MAVFLSEYLPDTDAYSNQQIVAKGLSRSKTEGKGRPFQLVGPFDIKNMLIPRPLFSHKGTFGHALVVAGATETMGAALIAAKSCLHAGAGLTTACITESGLTALNATLPEVMYLSREKLQEIDEQQMARYSIIAVGPGLGTSESALLKAVLSHNKPVIADADALNILAEHKKLIYELPAGSILTPHVKEFDYLFGSHKNWWDRLQTAIVKAAELDVVIVLKNQYTFIIDQSGQIAINPTGNPAMAQGGMGDALTGIIAAFRAQGYSPVDAAIIGVYIHGQAGDELAAHKHVVTASQLALQVSTTIKRFTTTG